ncbi:high choriolytic enzyme 1-like [Chaetodon auriga]|uniref:high choriolytic enzyme 1-like n=1 Tax=Chaetodon auriga TaxID=39042 RepID=UPI00403289B4
MDMKCILGLVVLLAVSAWAEERINQVLSASERIERANRNIVRSPGEPYVEDDIAYRSEFDRNADPCTASGCMWPKSSDGNVYVPYILSSVYTSREVAIIERGLQSFNDFSCIRFVRRTTQRDYLNIQSLGGCYSYIGRLGYEQELSLQQSGCVYYDTVQHEVLHALGFNHEQTRSDRDQYIRVEWQNITPGKEHNFYKINTLNQETTYDYGSVMHYHKYGFSSNGLPTLVAIPDANVEFGMATEMSEKDIIRLNRLYRC